MTRVVTGEQVIVPDTDPNWDESGFWDDLRFPGTGDGADTSTGRLYTDYTEACLVFASNARYTDEPWIMNVQFPHDWKQGSPMVPHIHWYQDEGNDPNWILSVRAAKKGEAPTAPWQLGIPAVQRVYTYPGSGRIHQITAWAELNLTGFTLSDMLQVILYRDSANASTLFAGADPYTIDALILEFDIHYLRENLGSPNEYYK